MAAVRLQADWNNKQAISEYKCVEFIYVILFIF